MIENLTIFTQPSQAAASGVAFAQQPVAILHDEAGAAVAGVDVRARVSHGEDALDGDTIIKTDAAGKATFTNLALTRQGNRHKDKITFWTAHTKSVESNEIVVT